MHSFAVSPAPGDRTVRHVGDTLRFTLTAEPRATPDAGWQARLRTTLGRATVLHQEIVQAHTARVPPFGASWHDIPLRWTGHAWERDLLLTEVGFFAAKPYLLDPQGRQHWPPGPDIGIGVHPDWCRSANTLYCAFVRLFGPTRPAPRLLPESHEPAVARLEKEGFAVLPPSGTFRDLRRQLPHIVQTLGCRILHLLPIHPTPTVFARFGRFGSPYAALDLTAVDPALVEFDQRTTGIEQFVELTRATHRLGARVFLDIVVNHTGWGSRLHEDHPEFFLRHPDGRFASPGAWGVTWEDLVELEQRDVALWDAIAEALLTWCRRGVDGFRCDAGYKIPTHVWQYVVARVRLEFPDTVFLLEGLGGSWEATETLLSQGGMQWAYSELFQNYSGSEIQRYLDYALSQSERVGTYVHYSETHDNDRLAARGHAWSLLRNRLCALTSSRGAFGFTCGVEWFAAEKIRVHQRTGLSWDARTNAVRELAALNHLLADHPAFFDGATLQRLSPPESPVFALQRTSRDGAWHALVLVNTLTDQGAEVIVPNTAPHATGPWTHELLGQPLPKTHPTPAGLTVRLAPAAALCLSPQPPPPAGFGEAWRDQRARSAWAAQTLAALVPPEDLLPGPEDALAEAARAVDEDPERWLATVSALRDTLSALPHPSAGLPLADVLQAWRENQAFPRVITWTLDDARRVTPIPAGWWLLLRDTQPFRARLHSDPETAAEFRPSLRAGGAHIACFPPRHPGRALQAWLEVERFDDGAAPTRAALQFLGTEPVGVPDIATSDLALLTNGRGGMARLRLDFGTIRSKYDCALAANLHPSVPVDRHVFAKRLRAWLNADGFISPLDRQNLVGFTQDPIAARWTFRANAGNRRCVSLTLAAGMVPERNTMVVRLQRDADDPPLPASVTLRIDLEDRSYHGETHRNPGADHHFATHCHTLRGETGFVFQPAPDRHLRATLDHGHYHPQPEWSEHLSHPEELSRGQVGEGDAYSPGWFEIPLQPGETATLVLDAESSPMTTADLAAALEPAAPASPPSVPRPPDPLADRLARAAEAFLVRRGPGRTVIAGYPWFLDWGRDTLIAARGLLAAGRAEAVLGILDAFARFAENGTLPNSIFGENASNRDTSDAPLWFGVVAEDFARLHGDEVLHRPLPHHPKATLLGTVRSLAEGYLAGTPNGIRVDPASALVWSPAHFTWMDTNHPAGTPREGYPVEIQALWIRTLQLLARNDDGPRAEQWSRLAERANHSLQSLFWLEDHGWPADVLLAPSGIPATDAVRDTALRCNMLFLPAFRILTGPRARRSVQAALRHLIVPGAVRSLAPLPVSPPLPIRSASGTLLNDPERPYWGRYEGDEDTRRKPAYHNGTAWTWILPTLAEALVEAWDHLPAAREAARSLLTSVEPLLDTGCHGHLPEILDGDAPHAPRGCDAQAWSVTETLRVWRALQEPPPR